jgi:hypothetical protein
MLALDATAAFTLKAVNITRTIPAAGHQCAVSSGTGEPTLGVINAVVHRYAELACVGPNVDAAI